MGASASGQELSSVRPHHVLSLKVEGQSFPFSVSFMPVGDNELKFVAQGACTQTYSTPWNPLEYGDFLWAQELQDSLVVIPVLIVLSTLVMDTELQLGPFPPMSGSSTTLPMRLGTGLDIPLGTGGMALLQCCLFAHLKMWPVAMPDASRCRWDYLLRTVQFVLDGLRSRRDERDDEEDDETSAYDKMDLDGLREEALRKCIDALRRVADDGAGSSGKGLEGFTDRLKRMEKSLLMKTPLRGATALQRMLLDLMADGCGGGIWDSFATDTGGFSSSIIR